MTNREIFGLLEQEYQRQQSTIELIASENIVSIDVLKAMGSYAVNKYAEGYPGARHYGGCGIIDAIETEAIRLACELFNCNFANVQPHCGTSANLAAFAALLEPGDKVLGMDLQCGAHLSHGSKFTASGTYYDSYTYGVKEDGTLNYDFIADQAKKIQPKLIVCGASAYSRIIDFKKFKDIADEVGAYLMADIAHIAGLVATGHHPSPVGFADIITSTTHKTLRGPRGGLILWNDESLSKKINQRVFPFSAGGPLEHIIAAKAIAFNEALHPSFSYYIQDVLKNIKTMEKVFNNMNIPMITGGSDNHLLLLDVASQHEKTGKQVETILEANHICVNKNAIPYDPQPQSVTSGIRIGTAAITTRGMRERECKFIAECIAQVIMFGNLHEDNKEQLKQITIDYPI